MKPRTARLGLGLATLLGGALMLAAYLAWQAAGIAERFEAMRWDAPAQVYAAPLEVYAGLALARDEFAGELLRLGYREVASPNRRGTFRRLPGAIEIVTRRFHFEDGVQPSRRLEVRFRAREVRDLHDGAGRRLPVLRLDPLLLGNTFAAGGEDRMIVAPHEIPPLLVDALKAVEDRRFDSHPGIDVLGIVRAAAANLRSGRLEQGGSTLTQQLVKNYFLGAERTWLRKAREAAMALALERRFDKHEILTAYVNEVYLGQDGPRAIHGFGLGAQFYFDKRLSELQLHEMALLVGLLRGPSLYDPRRYPERARERRSQVLAVLERERLISAGQRAGADDHELGIAERRGRYSTYHPAYLALVRRQLRAQYPPEELASAGLRVFTAFDALAQAQAERALADGLERLERTRALAIGSLEGAVVVTRAASAEVIAVVGGRRSGFDGFNRALDARRPMGSLVKPFVYLAALEAGYTLASPVDDQPIVVTLDTGETWSPANFDGEAHGRVPLVRALAQSYNLATVRLGSEVGVERVAQLMHRLGLNETPPPYPSLLLGAHELSPFEAAQLYTSLANGGFRSPLRTVRAVSSRDGRTLERYPLEIVQASDPAAVYQLNQALVQVMRKGTGRSASKWLPEGLTAAGKTGTSGEFRDSWFAGFTGDHVAVAWVGADDNRPTGLTGAAGALTVWAPLIAGLHGAIGYSPPAPPSLEEVSIDYGSGLRANRTCSKDLVSVAVPAGAAPEWAQGCGIDLRRVGSRLKEWFEGILK